MKRYYPSKPFPPYAFIPGRNPHPEKEGGHMQGVEIEVRPLNLDGSEYQHNSDYLFGIDLFNNLFFWESHVYWEALWHSASRKGKTADFLKALIKLAAAGVKYTMEQDDLGRAHLERSIELFKIVGEEDTLYGIPIFELITQVSEIIEESRDYHDLKINLKDIT